MKLNNVLIPIDDIRHQIKMLYLKRVKDQISNPLMANGTRKWLMVLQPKLGLSMKCRDNVTICRLRFRHTNVNS